MMQKYKIVCAACLYIYIYIYSLGQKFEAPRKTMLILEIFSFSFRYSVQSKQNVSIVC
jgi:hypothetical protein